MEYTHQKLVQPTSEHIDGEKLVLVNTWVVEIMRVPPTAA